MAKVTKDNMKARQATSTTRTMHTKRCRRDVGKRTAGCDVKKKQIARKAKCKTIDPKVNKLQHRAVAPDRQEKREATQDKKNGNRQGQNALHQK